MQVWNVLHAVRWKYSTQKWRKKWPPAHHRTTLSGYIFATKAFIDDRKKLVVKQQYLLHMFAQYGELGPLAAEICPVVWGTPANFSGFRVLVALLHSILVVGLSQILRRWTEGATYIRHGDHHVGHRPTLLVLCYSLFAYVCFCCVRFSFFSTMPRDWLIKNDLFCVEWDVKT